MPKPTQKPPVNHVHAQILDWFRTTRFRHTLFGGVDEAHLLKKLGELNALYEAALTAERARYEGLMNSYLDVARKKLAKSEEENKALRKQVADLRRTLGAKSSGERAGDG